MTTPERRDTVLPFDDSLRAQLGKRFLTDGDAEFETLPEMDTVERTSGDRHPLYLEFAKLQLPIIEWEAAALANRYGLLHGRWLLHRKDDPAGRQIRGDSLTDWQDIVTELHDLEALRRAARTVLAQSGHLGYAHARAVLRERVYIEGDPQPRPLRPLRLPAVQHAGEPYPPDYEPFTDWWEFKSDPVPAPGRESPEEQHANVALAYVAMRATNRLRDRHSRVEVHHELGSDHQIYRRLEASTLAGFLWAEFSEVVSAETRWCPGCEQVFRVQAQGGARQRRTRRDALFCPDRASTCRTRLNALPPQAQAQRLAMAGQSVAWIAKRVKETEAQVRRWTDAAMPEQPKGTNHA